MTAMYSCDAVRLAKNRRAARRRSVSYRARNGVPARQRALSILILLVGSCLNYIIPNPLRCSSLCTIAPTLLPGMVPWFVILISRLRFRRVHQAAIASHPSPSIAVSVGQLYDGHLIFSQDDVRAKMLFARCLSKKTGKV